MDVRRVDMGGRRPQLLIAAPGDVVRMLKDVLHDDADILVRALPVPLGRTQEAEIRESYRTLGVDEFFNWHGLERRHGRSTGLQKFRDSVLSQLPVR